jgi:hypothetical protein
MRIDHILGWGSFRIRPSRTCSEICHAFSRSTLCSGGLAFELTRTLKARLRTRLLLVHNQVLLSFEAANQCFVSNGAQRRLVRSALRDVGRVSDPPYLSWSLLRCADRRKFCHRSGQIRRWHRIYLRGRVTLEVTAPSRKPPAMGRSSRGTPRPPRRALLLAFKSRK